MNKILLVFLTIFSTNSFANTDPKTYIPPQAYQYLPTIQEQVNIIFPEFKLVAYFPALIEHESCITLKHSKCWNPQSELKTKRERGVGLSMLTIAFNSDGTTRFDSLTEIVKQNPKLLKELNWNNIPYRPDLQIRAMIIMTKNNYIALRGVPSTVQRISMSDSAYNGGLGSVNKSRTICKLASECDPNIWFNNVEKYSTKSKKILYGNRSAKDINLNHVRDVMTVRLPKYMLAYRSLQENNKSE